MHRARWSTLCLCAVLLIPKLAGGEEHTRQTPESVATAAERATTTKDAAALAKLAQTPGVDPWRVAHRLVLRGKPEVADAFAAAMPESVDARGLAPYLAACKSREVPDLRPALRAVREASTAAEAAKRAADVPLTDDVLAIVIHMTRAVALRRARQMPQSIEVFTATAKAAERIGWTAQESKLLADAVGGLERMSRFPAIVELSARRLALERKRGNRAAEAAALSDSAMGRLRTGDYDGAVEQIDAAVSIREALGDKRALAEVLNELGIIHFNYGRYGPAQAAWTRAKALADELGMQTLVAGLTVNLGNCLSRAGDAGGALEAYVEGAKLARAAGNTRFQAIALDNAAGRLNALGRLQEALALFDEALALKRQVGNHRALTSTLANRGVVLARLGNYDEAIASLDQALAMARESGDRLQEVHALLSMGRMYVQHGNGASALGFFESAADVAKAIRHAPMLLQALFWQGWTYEDLGNNDHAVRMFEEALRMAEASGQKAVIANVLRLGTKVYSDLDPAKALAFARGAFERSGGIPVDVSAVALGLKQLGQYEEALAMLATLDASQAKGPPSVDQAKHLVNKGAVLALMKRNEDAAGVLDEALRVADEVGAHRVASKAISERARVAYHTGNAEALVALAKDSIRRQPLLVRGLSEDLSATAREHHAMFHEDAVRAAASLEAVEDALLLLESVRAVSMLESLGGRTALRNVAVPEELRAEEQAKVGAVREAQLRLQAAKRRRDVRRIKKARGALTAAEASLLGVVSRIQRTAKSRAELVYPAAIDVEATKAMLAPDEAYVAYAWTHGVLTALVVTRTEARTSQVAAGEDAETLLQDVAMFETPPDERTEAAATRTNAAKLLVDPLALPASVKRVVIAPTNQLTYVPFALLMPKRTVAYVPSATVLASLRKVTTKPGDGVLALGDPAYAPGGLPRLPASGDEAKAVGDVTLIGTAATKAGLREALTTRTRWRAIHFACHGLVQPERPLLSSLALAPTKDDDGSLTVHEVLRLDLPADLVVLSACETARGKVYRAEGVMGFTRALMQAGAPRALVSLWKVDDEATRALMERFYALWNPKDASGLSAADALRQAQAHVRANAAWADPYYWAAWTLWGLPE